MIPIDGLSAATLWGGLAGAVSLYAGCALRDILVLQRKLRRIANPGLPTDRPTDPLTSIGKGLEDVVSALQYRVTALEWHVDAYNEAKKARARASTLTELAISSEAPSGESLIKLLLGQNEARFRGSFLAAVMAAKESHTVVATEDRGPAFSEAVTTFVDDYLRAGVETVLGLKDARSFPNEFNGLLYFGISSVITVPFAWVDKGEGKRGVLCIAYQSPHAPTTIEVKWAEELGAELQLRLQASTRIREAESSSREKSEFLAHISHDIRSPLNNIGNVLHLLRSEARDRHDTDLLDIAAANCTAMRDLIEAILDYSRLRAGKLEAQRETIDLTALLTEVAECYAVQARLRGVGLSITLPEQREVHVSVDGRQMKRVFSNLIGNAIKFTHEGGSVDVALSIHDSELRVKVRDTGVGMSPAAVKNLFVPFTRFHGSTVDGIGLGLVLSKTLMELNGGDIEVQSEEGVGTTFTVRIGRTATRAAPEARKIVPAKAKQITVLVVDDDAAMVDSLARLLEREGFSVSRAYSVSEALGVINFGRPDVVITDANMPGGGGGAVLKALRRADPDALGIVLTGSDDSAELRELESLGAAAVITKPAALDDLLSVIEGGNGATGRVAAVG